MTISNNTPRVQVTADGTVGPFTFNFKIFQDSDLRVFDEGTLKTLTTHYTIDFDYEDEEAESGTITFVVDEQPDNLDTITMDRRVSVARSTDFQQSGPPIEESINEEFDMLYAKAQEIDDSFDRLVRLSDTTEFSGDVIFPDGEADKAIVWNSAGDGLENKDLSDVGVVSLPLSFSNGGTGASYASLAALKTGMGLAGVGDANTFTENQTLDISGNLARIDLKSDRNTGFISQLPSSGQDDAANETVYGDIRVSAIDDTDGSEDGTFSFYTVRSGSLTSKLAIGGGIWTSGATGSDQGIGSINAQAFYENGVAIQPRWTEMSRQTASSETELDFSSIPDGVEEIVLDFNGVSGDGTSGWLIQVGTDSTPVTTGYEAQRTYGNGGTNVNHNTANTTNGFRIQNNGAAQTWSGCLHLHKVDSTNNVWCINGAVGRTDGAVGTHVYGRISLGSGNDLNILRLDFNGDTGDAGDVGVKYR